MCQDTFVKEKICQNEREEISKKSKVKQKGIILWHACVNSKRNASKWSDSRGESPIGDEGGERGSCLGVGTWGKAEAFSRCREACEVSLGWGGIGSAFVFKGDSGGLFDHEAGQVKNGSKEARWDIRVVFKNSKAAWVPQLKIVICFYFANFFDMNITEK